MIRAVVFDMYETLVTHFNCPTYFSGDIAKDAGLDVNIFRRVWNLLEDDCTLGKLTTDERIARTLKDNGCYTDGLHKKIMEKRVAVKNEVFRHMNPQIIPMLVLLKDHGYKLGLISNCFSEEAAAIHKCEMFPYFDVVCLSCEEGVAKPDPEIFFRCFERLNIRPEECLYVGDGGSRELETARALGANPLQARWYLKDGTDQVGVLGEFEGAEDPLAVVRIADRAAG